MFYMEPINGPIMGMELLSFLLEAEQNLDPQESAEGVIELDDEGVTMLWKAPPSSGKKAR